MGHKPENRDIICLDEMREVYRVPLVIGENGLTYHRPSGYDFIPETAVVRRLGAQYWEVHGTSIERVYDKPQTVRITKVGRLLCTCPYSWSLGLVCVHMAAVKRLDLPEREPVPESFIPFDFTLADELAAAEKPTTPSSCDISSEVHDGE
jgi:hypothetical protein